MNRRRLPLTTAVTRLAAILAALVLIAVPLQGQDAGTTPVHRSFVGSSAFVLANAFLSDSPDFYQLNYGYWLTARDVISVEAITWKYRAPLGIPYGSSFGAVEEEYPGFIREHGLGVAYQRFLLGNGYSALHALPLRQRYVDEDGSKIQDGFQLFLTLRFGYHLRLPGGRLFLEPSIAFTHWPINTNTPEAFAELDARWRNYFLFEPGLHLGVKF